MFFRFILPLFRLFCLPLQRKNETSPCDRATPYRKEMIKKIVALLLCLNTMSFANNPIRHRLPAVAPDTIPTQSGIQTPVAAVEEPLQTSVDLPEVLTSIINEMPAVLKMSEPEKAVATDLIKAAKQHIGARYHIGSSGPSAFDCSGFTSYVFKHLGITLKRSSQEQHRQGSAITSAKDLLPGDLVFFGRRGKHVSHVGIVVDVDPDGTFQFIHASTSRGVRIDDSTDDYWSPRFVGARRIIGTQI